MPKSLLYKSVQIKDIPTVESNFRGKSGCITDVVHSLEGTVGYIIELFNEDKSTLDVVIFNRHEFKLKQ